MIEKSEFEPRIREARRRLEQLKNQMQLEAASRKQQNEMRQVIGQLEKFAATIGKNLAHADWNLKRQLIYTLVKRVEVGQDELRVVYRVGDCPFDFAPLRDRPAFWRWLLAKLASHDSSFFVQCGE